MRSVREILSSKPQRIIAVTPDASVLEAIRLMAEQGVGAVLVMSGDDLEGILSERDYARKVILKERSSKNTPVRDIMSSPVITVDPSHRARHCMGLMNDKRIRHLPVVEGGQVVGVLSIGDLLKVVIEEQREEIDQLHQYISG